MNILGHGSHSPHAESAIRHIKNKARSTVASLPYTLPVRWSAALIAFVTHTVNMVPRSSSPGHISAYTSFTGRIPNIYKHAPHAFGIAGFLQRANTVRSNTADPRQDYCIWFGTTRNLAGTHQCFNIATLQMITGDIFRPAPLTPDAARRISRLASDKEFVEQSPLEPFLMNPSPPYPLDPNRGVLNDIAAAPPSQVHPSLEVQVHEADQIPSTIADDVTETPQIPTDTEQIMLQVSTIFLANKGRSTSERTRHIKIRY